MDSKIAVIAIIVEDNSVAEKINSILHEFSEFVIGRMGLPYKQRDISVISIIIDAPQEIINSISGKLGMINGVKSKVLTTK